MRILSKKIEKEIVEMLAENLIIAGSFNFPNKETLDRFTTNMSIIAYNACGMEGHKEMVEILQASNLKEMKRLSEIKIESIMDEMANAAWYGKKRTTTFCTEDGEKILTFFGHTYERGYEDFSATCEVRGYEDGKDVILYDLDSHCADSYKMETFTIGSMEEIQEYIRRHDCMVYECIQ